MTDISVWAAAYGRCLGSPAHKAAMVAADPLATQEERAAARAEILRAWDDEIVAALTEHREPAQPKP